MNSQTLKYNNDIVLCHGAIKGIQDQLEIVKDKILRFRQ